MSETNRIENPTSAMKIIRLIVAAISFVFVFIAVLLLTSAGLAMLFPTGEQEINLLQNWRGWIALLAALLAGIQSWKAAIRKRD